MADGPRASSGLLPRFLNSLPPLARGDGTIILGTVAVVGSSRLEPCAHLSAHRHRACGGALPCRGRNSAGHVYSNNEGIHARQPAYQGRCGRGAPRIPCVESSVLSIPGYHGTVTASGTIIHVGSGSGYRDCLQVLGGAGRGAPGPSLPNAALAASTLLAPAQPSLVPKWKPNYNMSEST